VSESIRQNRVVIALLILCWSSVASVVAVPNEPAVDGRSELLSSAELHSLLIVARQKLAPEGALTSIYRVHVITPTKVEAWYGDANAVDSECLILERTKHGWRVTGSGGMKRS
jgi:hypothetical protein